MRRQLPLKPEEMAILRKKIGTFITKGYIMPTELKITSLIKSFVVSKGVVGGVVQDWRIVFHARANKLNNSIWAPPFLLPFVNSLLCIVDLLMTMSKQDMGEMFLSFQLHPDTVQSAATDLCLLDFSFAKASHRWMCWQ